ncbi:MAG: shikimate kinase [Cyclobacteriaceae bacterium]
MKIFLIGMPGSGKTTLGKELASHLLVDFVDLDAEIEKAEQRSIPEIFSQRGEEYFRILEARLLGEWAGSTSDFVMATGGGAPCFYNGMETINQYGLSVFLDCSVSTLIERVKKNQERPLLLISDENELKQKLKRMLEARMECYRQARIIIENPSLHGLLKKIKAIN